MVNKIDKFTDLVAWQKAHRLALSVYKLSLMFPKIEQYGLTSQLQPSAVSVSSNIVEGFSRSSSKDKQNYYIIAVSSLVELRSQLILAKDLGYISSVQYVMIENIAEEVSKLIWGLKKTIAIPK